MLPGYRRRDIEGILNDSRYSWDIRRDRINNYLKTYIPYDTIKSYSKILSDKLKRQFEEDFQKTRSHLDKLFRDKFKFLKLKDGSFPPLNIEFSERDFENMPGKKYIRDEIYTGPYDRSITQRINTNVDGSNAIISMNRGIDRIPAGGFRGVYRPYRYCIPIC
uniref:Uncharacterized protein n=1 Tax=Strongyloides papillosus TaxID=174720 RepID=A0A0N5BAQ6_STREA